jgi:hypothetical protein
LCVSSRLETCPSLSTTFGAGVTCNANHFATYRSLLVKSRPRVKVRLPEPAVLHITAHFRKTVGARHTDPANYTRSPTSTVSRAGFLRFATSHRWLAW